MEQRKFYQQKLLRYGYTTGSCAAGAAKAATLMLCTGRKVDRVPLMTPGGVLLELEVLDPVLDEKSASCAVRKDGGDDPDATSGLLIYARVQRISRGIQIEGGRRRGPGDQARPGSARGRRRDQPCAPPDDSGGGAGGHGRRARRHGGHHLCTRGEEVGRKTFNPHLGIVGGISILGTSGIVEPMSQQALIDTTRVELNMRRALGDTDLLLTVGNYGDDFARYKLGLSLERRIKCSNFVGQTLSDAAALGFHRVLLIGHIGKLVKLGAGILNTHSSQADARMEILVSCALARGASLEALRAVAACVTTEAALQELRRFHMLEPTMEELGCRVTAQLERRFGDFLELGVVIFSGQREEGQILCLCGRGGALLEHWRRLS